MQNKQASLTRGGQVPLEGWPMWLWCGWPWCTWCPWWFWLCCEWVWWLSGLVLCPWPKGDIIFFWPGMLLACIRAMLDSTASQPSNPAWQHKQNVKVKQWRWQDSSHRHRVRGKERGTEEWEWQINAHNKTMMVIWRWRDFHWPISYGLEQNCWNGVSSPCFECVCVWGDRGASLRMRGDRWDYTLQNHQGPKSESKGIWIYDQKCMRSFNVCCLSGRKAQVVWCMADRKQQSKVKWEKMMEKWSQPPKAQCICVSNTLLKQIRHWR